MSNPTSQSKIYATVVHLVDQLTEQHTSAAMLIEHDAYQSRSGHRKGTKANSNEIIRGLEECG